MLLFSWNMILRFVYTIFIGVLIATFVGVGIAAFYESPKFPEPPASLKLAEMIGCKDPTVIPNLKKDQEEHDKQFKAFEEKMEVYNRNVSIASLIAAILILVISLTFFRKILLIADGLLLGGVLTLIYSIARGFGSGDNKFRFIVVTFGLAISLILGYIKFIKPAKNR